MRGGLQERGSDRGVRSLRRAAAFALLLACSGCATGKTIADAGLDRDTLTGSIAADASDRTSDEITIRNAVSSADLGALAGKPLTWANRDTGSSGTIEAIAESKEGGRVCRSFRAVIESYEGVRLHKGTACLADGTWRMTAFEAV